MERAAVSTSSTESGPGAPPDRLLAGRITGAHGLRGGLRVRCAAGDAETLLEVESVFLGARPEAARRFEVRRAHPGRRGEVCLDLAGVASRSAAEALRGADLWIDPAQLAALPEGEYRAFQLVGCAVEDGAGRRLGTVRGVAGNGAQDVLVVEGEAGEAHLIPAVRQWWREVDLARRRIVVELPPGLLGPA
jgi:16S rRNA processing protein RimM